MEHKKGFFMKKCIKCNGHKTLLGMGGMRLKCPECKGIGFMMEAKQPEKNVVAEVYEIDKEPRTVVTPVIKPNLKKVKVNSVKVEQPTV